MSNQEGFWWSFGRACYKGFEILEWTYETLSPNIVLIFVGFVATGAWVYVQQKYNKQAQADGTLK